MYLHLKFYVERANHCRNSYLSGFSQSLLLQLPLKKVALHQIFYLHEHLYDVAVFTWAIICTFCNETWNTYGKTYICCKCETKCFGVSFIQKWKSNKKRKKVFHHPNISKYYKSNSVLYETTISNHFHLLVEVKWLTLNDRKRKCLTRQ